MKEVIYEQMREIKNRYWDMDCDQMFYDIDYDDICGIKMQGIDIKDKTGKDIYEADFCTFELSDPSVVVKGELEGTVIFDKGSFKLKTTLNLFCLCKINLKTITVIGNIFEDNQCNTIIEKKIFNNYLYKNK